MRRFNRDWFLKYKNWLEYSIKKDAAFCLCCYLFRADSNKAGADAFITEGFKSWNRINKLDIHVGGVNSPHDQAVKMGEPLMKQQ